jgi:hypothetical protein
MSVPRVLAVIGLVVVGIVLLPLIASVLDGQGTENLILPVHLVVMAVLGALVWRALPASADARAATTTGAQAVEGRASSGRVLLVGAAVGVAAAVVALLLFFVLLSGAGGA